MPNHSKPTLYVLDAEDLVALLPPCLIQKKEKSSTTDGSSSTEDPSSRGRGNSHAV